MYSIEGLQNGIARAEHNITVLRDAVKKEEATILEYKKMIRALRAAEKLKQPIQVEVVRVGDDGGSD